MAPTAPSDKFFIDVDIGHTCLLLADIQAQIAGRFPQAEVDQLVAHVKRLLNRFRAEIQTRRSNPSQYRSPNDAHDGVPLIVHQVVPMGLNANSFVSPYSKMTLLFKRLEASGVFKNQPSDPNTPNYAILDELRPPNNAWGSADEIIVTKLLVSCFSSSDLLTYLRSRGIKHIVLCGLTTVGAIQSSVYSGTDLDYHIIVPREGVMDDSKEVNTFLLDRVFPKFADVVNVEDVEALFQQ